MLGPTIVIPCAQRLGSVRHLHPKDMSHLYPHTFAAGTSLGTTVVDIASEARNVSLSSSGACARKRPLLRAAGPPSRGAPFRRRPAWLRAVISVQPLGRGEVWPGFQKPQEKKTRRHCWKIPRTTAQEPIISGSNDFANPLGNISKCFVQNLSSRLP